MNRTSLIASCALAFILAAPVFAEPDCKDWNTDNFHRTATASHTSRCLDAGADVNARNGFENTPLHYAAGSGRPEIVKILISAGANINAQSFSGQAPLHWVIGSNSLEILNLLISAGATPDARDGNGHTPLHWAAGLGTAEMVNVLIAAGANLEAQGEYGETPLHRAVAIGTVETINALISAGANVNAKNGYGNTPLDLAKYNENLSGTDAYRLLTESGDTNEGEKGISVFGIDWSQEPMRQTIESLGYRCVTAVNHLLTTPKPIPGQFMCSTEDKKIHLNPNSKVITFFCEGFDFCGYSIEEIAQGIVDSGVISKLEAYEDSYCGQGPMKDRLCVARAGLTRWLLPNFDIADNIVIELHKHNFGRGELNFK